MIEILNIFGLSHSISLYTQDEQFNRIGIIFTEENTLYWIIVVEHSSTCIGYGKPIVWYNKSEFFSDQLVMYWYFQNFVAIQIQ